MNIMVLRLVIAFLQLALLHSWCPSHGHSRALLHLSGRPSSAYRHSTKIELSAGGFGGQSQSESSKKKKGNSDRKLKPKQQWDRYLDMKNEKRYRVAVKVADDDEWLEVGTVKSQDDKYTEFAVARQRALIVEHARRLFPLQISLKATIEWAYQNLDSEEWFVVDKSVLETSDVPEGLEKMIGFEGRPDPSSGYYCVYNEGRIVSPSDDVRPSSKKLK